MGLARQWLQRGKADAAAVAGDAGLRRGGFARAGSAQEREEGKASGLARGERPAGRNERKEGVRRILPFLFPNRFPKALSNRF